VNGSKSVAVGQYQATLREIDLNIGLRVETLTLTGVGLTIQKDKPQIHVVAPAKFELVVLDSALASVIESKAPAGLKNLKIRSESGKLVIEAVKKILVDLPVSAACTLRIENRTQVFVDMESVDVMGASIGQLFQSQLEKVNPILDVVQLPFPAMLDKIELLDGKIVVFGEVSPPE
jgi:hypothetical protein